MVPPGGPVAPAVLRVRVLGGLAVDGVDLARLGSRKGRTLVKRLALARSRPVPVDTLVDVLWPGSPPLHPGDQVSVLISRARAVLGADRLPRSDAGYALRAEWLDLDAAAELVAEARRRLAAGGVGPARAATSAALALLTGPLLPDEPDADWLAADRAAATRLAVSARVLGAESALAAGAPAEAVELARQALDRDPYDEAAVRALVAATAAAGRPAAALVAYSESVARLRDDLGVDPSAETEAVYLSVLRGAGTGTPRPAPAPAASLPGRGSQLAALDVALDQVTAGDAAVVVVEGEAGIGKTLLLDTWAAGAAARQVTVLRGAGDEVAGGLPLQPVLDAVRQHLRDQGPAAAAAALGDDHGLVGPLVGQAPADASALSLAYTILTGPSSGRGLLFAALVAVLRRIAATGPVALLVDDAHLVDASTADWLQYAARRLAAPVLLVAARRPGEGPAVAAQTTIGLDRLDLAAVTEIVGARLAPALHARSGGHPLFLVELARWTGTGLPETIRTAVADRVARAGAAAGTVQAAAVLGDPVDLDLLAAVLDTSAAHLLDDLEEGLRRRLLAERPAGFGFDHELVREALAAGVSAGRQALLHRRAAVALAARTGADPLAVAYHARLGGERELAGAALAAAADLAARRYEFAEALRLADAAVAQLDGGPARLARARALLALGRYTEAAVDAGLARAAGAGTPALEVAAWAAYLLRDWPEALRLADEAASAATDAAERGAALLVAGQTQQAAGHQDDARRRLVAAYEEVPASLRSVARVFLARLRVSEGDPAAALSLLAGPELPDGLAHPYVSPHRHLTAAHAYALAGRPGAALAELDRLDEAVARQHATRFACRSLNYRAWLLRNLGAPAEADDLNARAFADADMLGFGEPRAHAALDLADGRLRAGDVDAAARWLHWYAEGTAEHALRWRVEQRARSLQVRLALARGDGELAEDSAAAALAKARMNGDRRHAALCELLLARARHVRGRRVDLDPLDPVVRSLDRLAGLEAWWLSAQLAREFAVPSWQRLAEQRLVRTLTAAGPWADPLRAAAADVFDPG